MDVLLHHGDVDSIPSQVGLGSDGLLVVVVPTSSWSHATDMDVTTRVTVAELFRNSRRVRPRDEVSRGTTS
jgi:hypothetical protein